jgi:hypothetical protein
MLLDAERHAGVPISQAPRMPRRTPRTGSPGHLHTRRSECSKSLIRGSSRKGVNPLLAAEGGAFLACTGPRAAVQNGGVDDTRASQRCLAGYL